MKKILLSLALLASISFGVSAQGKDGRHRGGDRTKALQELNLTAEQQAKMKALSEDFKTKNSALRNQQKDLRKTHQENIKALLTPEQQVKWQAMIDKKTKGDNRGGKNFGNRNRGGKQMKLDAATSEKLADLRSNFEKEKKAVEMTRIAPEAQKERIQALRDKYRSDKREIIKGARLTKSENRAA